MSLIILWLRAWVLAMLSRFLPVAASDSTIALIPECLNINTLYTLTEGVCSFIIRFVQWLYSPLFLLYAGYFDTS